jgi:hypothetical protein
MKMTEEDRKEEREAGSAGHDAEEDGREKKAVRQNERKGNQV